ncbi:polysaccharide pyruvyl transferase family protein [Microbacterium sp. SD291]|uniref:polysaccharide pyruvyl transferase family protein n=1 Tax=Microbacterium sp. SD291 TaxID=2782007 RepID=UPI001A95A119|nr:polysaccharide pyruvyl transferase family protein [Microbacterium sp. SD291]MBO0980975.1 polysaccharide pyruvyl transferase family protein [Microbacterium sp. SD291]
MLPRYGIAPVLTRAADAELFGVGSILEQVPSEFQGWVWGSGKMQDDQPTQIPAAQVLAVRGRLTRDLLGLAGSTRLGDPGLLVSRGIRRAPLSGRIAIVPHFSHRGSAEVDALVKRLGQAAYVIDVTDRPKKVIRRISAADAVISTSLHGLIVADAYGIPAVWALPEPMLGGGAFKFHDYESVVLPGGGSRRIDLAAVRTKSDVDELASCADGDAVARAQSELEQALSDLKRSLPRRITPFRLALEQARS